MPYCFSTPMLVAMGEYLKKYGADMEEIGHLMTLAYERRMIMIPGFARYHNLLCTVANFARQWGYGDYMPYICNLDYVMFGIGGAPLFREHTCMEKDGFCDFKLKTGAAPMEY